MEIAMSETSEVEAVIVYLLDAVVNNQELAQEAEVLPIGGYLWKFPSEGSNWVQKSDFQPPPAPPFRDYPRRCDQCGMCWVSDRDYELDHLKQCFGSKNSENIKGKAGKLGVARRAWCEVDESLSNLQWRHERAVNSQDSDFSSINCIAFSDIIDVSVLDEPANSFQIVTRGDRTVVFQARPKTGLEATQNLVLNQLELTAQQWKEYLDELSNYERNLCLEKLMTSKALISADTIAKSLFDKVSRFLLSQQDAQVIEHKLYSFLMSLGCHSHRWSSVCDDDGNSLLHFAINLNIKEHRAPATSTLLQLGIDCNLQNQEGESPLLVVAASGDLTTARVLLGAPLIQVDLPCALGATAFHAAANAGDIRMMQLLYNSGAQPELQDENGWTALHYAAACSSGLEALHFLCEIVNDGLIDAQCSEGNTALHVAAGCGYLDNVRALLETAASPHLCNFSGESAYHLALRNSHIQCAVAIKEYEMIPVMTYSNLSPALTKESVVMKATATTQLKAQGGEWVECFTEDGDAYYCNLVTGDSSWYKPGEFYPPDSWNEEHDSEIDDLDTKPTFSLSTNPNSGSICTGHQLPLCLIPMVSPLTSLDNPTAAAKYEEQRRKARKQRKRRVYKGQMTYNQGDYNDVQCTG